MVKNLSEIHEQELAKQVLQGYLESYPPPLLIFHGPPGVGKWSVAEAFIRQSLCKQGNACGQCLACHRLLENEHSDYIRFPQAKILIGDEKNPEPFSVRWLLRTRLPYSPLEASTRFVLFPEAQNIQNEAETALLKTLEETPKHTRFIMLVNDLSRLKATIISRGTCVPFFLLSDETIRKITNYHNKLELQCLGGSLEKAPILGTKLYPQMKTKIIEGFRHPLELIALEKWLRQLENPKVILRETEMELSYREVLEFFALLLLILMRDSSAYPKLSAAVFQFKEDLGLAMNALENYLLSRLFAAIYLLYFSREASKNN